MKKVFMRTISSIGKRTVAILASACILVGVLQAARVVADPSCSLSKSGTAEVGKTVSINVGVSGDGPYGGFDGSVSYDSSFFELVSISAGSYGAANFGKSGSHFLDYNCNIPSGSTIVVIQLKCLKEGSSSVSVSLEVSSLDGLASYSTGSSATVEIKAPVVLSGNNYLSSLSVAPGSLSPSFSKDKTSYHVTVSESQTSIAVSATAEHSKASVSTNGVQNSLSKGDNTVKITVTAENGDTRTYKILVTRGAPTPTPEPYPVIMTNGESYTILEPKSLETVPSGFTWSETTYNSKKVPCLVGPDGTLLMWLLSDEGNGLYRYDLDSQTVSACYAYQFEARSLMFMPFPAEFVCPNGFEATTFQYNEFSVPAFKNTAVEGQPILVYLLDEEGHEGVYYMDEETGMIIPFRGDIADLIATPTPTPTPSPTPTPTPTPTNSPTPTEVPKTTLLGGNFFKISTIALGVITIGLLAALIVLLGLRAKDHAEFEEEVPEEAETDANEENSEEADSTEEEDQGDHYYQFGDEEAPRRPGAKRAGDDLDSQPAPDFPEFPEKTTVIVPEQTSAPETILNVVDDMSAIEAEEKPKAIEEGDVWEKLESGMNEEKPVEETSSETDDTDHDKSEQATDESHGDESTDEPSDDVDDTDDSSDDADDSSKA